jgi:hypothetical protein
MRSHKLNYDCVDFWVYHCYRRLGFRVALAAYFCGLQGARSKLCRVSGSQRSYNWAILIYHIIY